MDAEKEVSIRRDLGRLIAHGIAAKLAFDHACLREGMFNEIYLHGTMNELIVSILSMDDFWIRPGHPHDSLKDEAASTRKSGRSRELDFFVTPTRGRSGKSLALEVKWTSSSHCNWRSITLDLYRLKILAMENGGMDCMFVLSGPRSEVVNVLAKLQAASQKRAIGRTYGESIYLRTEGLGDGSGRLAPVDENGRFLGGDSLRSKLPLGSNGKRKTPATIKLQLLGESTVGRRSWTAAVWRVA